MFILTSFVLPLGVLQPLPCNFVYVGRDACSSRLTEAVLRASRCQLRKVTRSLMIFENLGNFTIARPHAWKSLMRTFQNVWRKSIADLWPPSHIASQLLIYSFSMSSWSLDISFRYSFKICQLRICFFFWNFVL